MARHPRARLVAGPDHVPTPGTPSINQRCDHIEPNQWLVPEEEEHPFRRAGIGLLERGEPKPQRVGKPALRRIVDNDAKTGAVGERQSPVIVRCNDNVPAIEQAALPRSLHDVEHVVQEWPTPVQGMELTAPEPTALACREN
jgi:hypothetical protein